MGELGVAFAHEAVKKSGKLIVLALRHGVEFVIVTLGTFQRQAQHRRLTTPTSGIY